MWNRVVDGVSGDGLAAAGCSELARPARDAPGRALSDLTAPAAVLNSAWDENKAPEQPVDPVQEQTENQNLGTANLPAAQGPAVARADREDSKVGCRKPNSSNTRPSGRLSASHRTTETSPVLIR